MNIKFQQTPPSPKNIAARAVTIFLFLGNCVHNAFMIGIELIAKAEAGKKTENITMVIMVNLI